MKRIYVICIMVMLIRFVNLNATDFKLGCYSYLKANSNVSALNDAMIGYMSDAHYNLTICDTNEADGHDDTDDLVSRLSSAGIESWLTDFIKEDQSSGAIGAHTASTGNKWQFEAEYNAVTNLNPSDDAYHYMFDSPFPRQLLLSNINPDYIWRVGQPYDYPEDGPKVWRCGPDDIGVALHGMKYRWLNHEPGTDEHLLSSPDCDEKLFGPEIRFAAWKNNLSDWTSYLQNNKLLITYCYHVESDRLPDPEVIEFRCVMKNSSETWQFVPIENTRQSNGPMSCLRYSYNELLNDAFSDQHPDYNYDNYPFRTITFKNRSHVSLQ